MAFYFDSWADFMAMDGHGGYVWACYAITWAVLLYLLISPWVRRRRWVRRQAIARQRMSHATQKRAGQ
ncbi:heme exporter protein CcmD [Marinimicrobium sp. ARAG 43.8]|uniref:heme exporter protein CcmD n=1 Tax=Marinimicrobium sp. ARAG 43.8 TaxID=3418719 RepID=UPI003CEE251E